MEYIIVFIDAGIAKKISSIFKKIPVLINGEKNGYVGETVMVEEGITTISVDMPGAIASEVAVEDTIPEEPMKIFIKIK